MVPTVLRVEGVRALPQGGVAGRTAKTLPVEVEPLSTDPLHHVNTPLARVTLVTGWEERLSHGATLVTRPQQSDGEGGKT